MLVVEARAKVNLYLRVDERRADGYHNIRTIFHSISLADRLEIEEAEDLQVTCSDADLPSGPGNLAYKAAELLRQKSGARRGAHIHIHKVIPSQAGLGGGSADAAGALVGLNQLWQLGASDTELEVLGASLGADVPFCVRGGAAYAEGVGERLTILPALPPFWLVIIKPATPISTREAYAALDAQPQRRSPPPDAALAALRSASSPSFQSPYREEVHESDAFHFHTHTPTHPHTSFVFGSARLDDLPAVMHNDFQSIALAGYPEVRDAYNALRSRTPAALLCGSGSALFGLVGEQEQAEKIARQLCDIGWNTIAAHFESSGQIIVTRA